MKKQITFTVLFTVFFGFLGQTFADRGYDKDSRHNKRYENSNRRSRLSRSERRYDRRDRRSRRDRREGRRDERRYERRRDDRRYDRRRDDHRDSRGYDRRRGRYDRYDLRPEMRRPNYDRLYDRYQRRETKKFIRTMQKPIKWVLPMIMNIILPFAIGSWIAGDRVGGLTNVIGWGVCIGAGLLAASTGGVGFALISVLASIAAFVTPLISLPIHIYQHNKRLKIAEWERRRRYSQLDAPPLSLPQTQTVSFSTIHF